jgi:hypothetical protein
MVYFHGGSKGPYLTVMVRSRLCLVATGIWCTFAGPCISAQYVLVAPTSNPYLLNAAPIGDGTAPTPIMVPAGAISVQFSAFGDVSCNPLFGGFFGPDGTTVSACGEIRTNVTSGGGGISGIQSSSGVMFLIGVFLGPTAPVAGTAPATLNYDGDSLSFTELTYAPLLNQAFFIGDGFAGGKAQTFVIPDGATRLVLGYADGFDGDAFHGPPAAYYDNASQTGGMTVFYDFSSGSEGAESNTVDLEERHGGNGRIPPAAVKRRLADCRGVQCCAETRCAGVHPD